jgi:HEAT repeat protein
LPDPDGQVRGRAAEALGLLRDRRAVEPLVAALKDPDVGVRMDAASALGALGEIAGSHLGTDAEKWRKWRKEKVGWS